MIEDLGNGIHCIDTGLYRERLAACYLIRQGDRLAFVDTGTGNTVPRLLEVIGDMGLSPEQVDYVIPTHVHLDHAGGAGALMAVCANAKLIIHPKGAPHMIDPSKLTAGATAVYGEAAFSRDFGTLEPVPEERVIVTQDGQEVLLGDRKLTIVHTLGHANHHFCVFDDRSRGFFTGDTYGIAYPQLRSASGPFLFAPTTPVAFDPDAWRQSIDNLMAYHPQAMFLTHFGRLDEPERFEQMLRGSINDLAGIALEEEGNGTEGRTERLHSAVEAYLAVGAVENGCALPRDQIERLLEVDARLNAQGLEVWLKRRAKARMA